MSDNHTTTAPAALSASELFDDWLSVREKASYDPLSREAAVPYRYIWKKWCGWLAEQRDSLDPLLYKDATSSEVHRFLLTGPSPSSKRKSASAPISPVTRDRYGRVLREIYAHGVSWGHMARNPVTMESVGAAPTDAERSGQILPPRVFEAMYRVLPLDPTTYEKRDNAIILILLECGLTSAELRGLRLDQIEKDFQHTGQYRLRIEGYRSAAQDRTISTSGAAGQALHKWLVHRKVMHRSTDVVFISEKRGPMSIQALFRLVAKVTGLACTLSGMEVPAHVGPSVIRNSLIVRLLNAGVPGDEVAKRMGVKEAKTLMRGLGLHLQQQ